MNLSKRWVKLMFGLRGGFIAVGVLLLLPAAWYCWTSTWIDQPVGPKDLEAAFRRLAVFPLRNLKAGGFVELAVVAPSDRVWSRIRRAWGDPGYIVTVVSAPPKRFLYCLKDLGVTVQSTIDRTALPMETAEYPPYGYSCDCRPAGLLFRAPPGATVRLIISTERPFTDQAELVVEPYWTKGTKDRVVGVLLNHGLHIEPIVIVLAAVGITVILCAAYFFRHRQFPAP